MRRNKKRGFHVEFRELYSYTGLGAVYSSEEIFFFCCLAVVGMFGFLARSLAVSIEYPCFYHTCTRKYDGIYERVCVGA